MGAGFSGGLVADAAGEGTVSGSTLRVGSGNGGALRLLLLLAFTLGVGAGLNSSRGSTEGSKLAAGLAVAFTAGLTVPPAGMPSSPLPVAGGDGCTGWLFGSAERVCVS